MSSEHVMLLGGAQTDFERNYTREGKNEIGLISEVVHDALREAGVALDEVIRLNRDNRIVCCIGNFIAEDYVRQGHLGALITMVDEAFSGIPSARYEAACASGSAAIDAAMNKIRSGDYDVAIVIGWELMKTVSSSQGGSYIGKAAYNRLEAEGVDFPFPKLFSKLGEEYLERYALDRDVFLSCLAKISDQNYQNAKRNPNAQTRKWFMNEAQAASRGNETNPIVGGLLAVSDCSQITDGAAAVILCSDRYAKEHHRKDCPVIKGYGHRVAPMLLEKKLQESRTMDGGSYVLPWTRRAVQEAFGRAEMDITAIDVIETHDCFTTSEYAQISAFGITEPGKEYEAVLDGVIFRGGRYPVNPSGGLIGCGHPIGATGVRMMLDLYKQVTGKAGNYQVPHAKNAMMLNIGGTATTNFTFIVGI